MPACGGSETIETVTDPGSLVIYSGRSESLVGPIIEEFERISGIDVGVKYAKTPQLAATLLEEGSSSPADLFFAQDPGGLGAIEELLTPLPTSILDNVPDWARSNDGLWVGISGRARTLVYNTERLGEDDLPNDMWGLTDPKWKGRIGWAPSNASFQTMITGMRVQWGEARTTEWLEGMIKNDPVPYPKNTPQVAAVAAGEIDLGLVNHYYLFRFLAEEGDAFPARNYHMRNGGPGALVMVAGTGILKQAKNPENAQTLIEFFLSKVGQQYFTSSTFEYPLVEGTKVNRLLVPLDEIKQPKIGASDLADLDGTQKLFQQLGILP